VGEKKLMKPVRVIIALAALTLTLVFVAPAQADHGMKVSFDGELNDGVGDCILNIHAVWKERPGQTVVHFALLDVTTGGFIDHPDRPILPTDTDPKGNTFERDSFPATSTPGVFDSFVAAVQVRDNLGRELASGDTTFRADCRIPGV
jgi:hypothetical protein